MKLFLKDKYYSASSFKEFATLWNVRFVLIIASFLTVLLPVILFVDRSFHFHDNFWDSYLYHNLYLIHISGLIFNVLVLLVYFVIHQKISTNSLAYFFWFSIFGIIVFFLSITINGQFINGNISVFIILILCSGIFFNYSDKERFVFIVIPSIITALSIYFFQLEPDIRVGLIVNSLSVGLFSVVISRYMRSVWRDLYRNNKIIESQKEQLEEANLDLKQLIYSISHDMREPIRNSIQFGELLERFISPKLDDKEKQFLDHLNRSTSRALIMLSTLSDYNRINVSDDLKIIDLNEVFLISKANLQRKIEESGAQIFCDKLPTIQANETYLVQVFQNLISNAVKYKSEDIPTLHITTETIHKNHIIRFRDNGVGIPVEFQEEVFDLYKRLPKTSRVEGSGLGLAICKRIVEKMKGKIYVNPEYIGGTEVVLQFNAM